MRVGASASVALARIALGKVALGKAALTSCVMSHANLELVGNLRVFEHGVKSNAQLSVTSAFLEMPMHTNIECGGWQTKTMSFVAAGRTLLQVGYCCIH